MNKNLIIILAFLTTAGCMNKFESYDFENSLFTEGAMLPLAHAELEAKDIFSIVFDNTSLIQTIGENGEILFSLTDNIATIGLMDLVAIAPASNQTEVPFNYFNYNREYSTTMEVPFSSSLAEINKANLSYKLKFKAANFSEPVHFSINIPGLNPAAGGKNIEVELNGNQEIEFEFENEDIELSNNALSINIDAKPSRQTGVYHNYIGIFTTEINDIEIHSITGVFEDFSLPLEGSFDIGFSEIDQLTENKPEVHFIIKNSSPLQGIFDIDIYGALPDGDQQELTHPELLLFASDYLGGENRVSLNENNSNIVSVLESSQEFSYLGNLGIGNQNNSMIEIDEHDSITLEYLLEFPAKFEFSTCIESSYLTVSESEMINKLTDATLSLEVFNEFPLKSQLVMKLFDDNDLATDSIVFPDILPASVDDNGIVSTIEPQILNRELTPSELNKLKAMNKFTIKVEMDTDNTKAILKEDYRFELKLALKAKK